MIPHVSGQDLEGPYERIKRLETVGLRVFRRLGGCGNFLFNASAKAIFFYAVSFFS